MYIKKNKSLKSLNTFGIDANAKFFVEINNENDISELTKRNVFKENKHFVLGGGSNILFLNDYDGLIIKLSFKGINLIESDDNNVIIDVSAGEPWHGFVEYCLENNYFGLENLALIPGTVGAAPVQNIGAYGVEQKDFFLSANCFDIENQEFNILNYDDCLFSYRNSIFKNELKNNFVITSVQYKLSRKPILNTSYKAIQHEIQESDLVDINSATIFNLVCKLRNSKLPDPSEFGNAGSFFKNPSIDEDSFKELNIEFPDIPYYINPDRSIKIPAAWLIEQCEWKGKQIGNVGVYPQHSLIIINHGNATGEEIFDFSEKIIEDVLNKFKITLEREVQIVR